MDIFMNKLIDQT